MKAVPRQLRSAIPATLFTGILTIFLTAMPLVAAEDSNAPSPADTAVGTIFRWLNFVIVFGAIVYAVAKFGGPFFRANAQAISDSIKQAGGELAAAERDLQEATRQLAGVELEIQDMRRAAVKESAAEAERLRELARAEADKIAQAARAEIEASDRAAHQELRVLAARLATERAAAMVRARMSAGAEAMLFRSFLGQLERSAP